MAKRNLKKIGVNEILGTNILEGGGKGGGMGLKFDFSSLKKGIKRMFGKGNQSLKITKPKKHKKSTGVKEAKGIKDPQASSIPELSGFTQNAPVFTVREPHKGTKFSGAKFDDKGNPLGKTSVNIGGGIFPAPKNSGLDKKRKVSFDKYKPGVKPLKRRPTPAVKFVTEGKMQMRRNPHTGEQIKQRGLFVEAKGKVQEDVWTPEEIKSTYKVGTKYQTDADIKNVDKGVAKQRTPGAYGDGDSEIKLIRPQTKDELKGQYVNKEDLKEARAFHKELGYKPEEFRPATEADLPKSPTQAVRHGIGKKIDNTATQPDVVRVGDQIKEYKKKKKQQSEVSSGTIGSDYQEKIVLTKPHGKKKVGDSYSGNTTITQQWWRGKTLGKIAKTPKENRTDTVTKIEGYKRTRAPSAKDLEKKAAREASIEASMERGRKRAEKKWEVEDRKYLKSLSSKERKQELKLRAYDKFRAAKDEAQDVNEPLKQRYKRRYKKEAPDYLSRRFF